MRALACVVASWMMGAASAHATANVSCLIDYRNVRFELAAIAGSTGPIIQVHSGTLRIKPAPDAMAASPESAFKREHIIQQWMLGDELRLQIEIADEASGQNVNLVIFGRLDQKQDKYFGRYVLRISRAGASRELHGRIKQCEAG